MGENGEGGQRRQARTKLTELRPGFPPLDEKTCSGEMLRGGVFIRGAARWPTRTMGKFAPSTRMMPIVRGFSTQQQPGLGCAGTVWCWGEL